jgi:4-amino-4-deoxy-L-arabinose transferase-like glycosyltransferase
MLEVLRGASGRSRVGLLLLGVPFLLCLGTAPLFDVDEGAFAEASREMWASADFGHTTLNGVDRFDKPVAVYWLQALAIGLLGPGEWAVRLPSALCAWALCVAVAKFACTQWGRATGGWAAVLLASNLGLLVIGRASTADALLNLCLGLTALDLCRHLMTGSAWPLRRAALWVGIGVMTKGPVAVLIPGATLCLWWLSYRDGKKARQALSDLWSWAIVLVVAAPWYLYAWGRHGEAFVNGFLVKHNLERFSSAMEGHAGSVLYFVVLLPVLWLPWTGLLVPVLARFRDQWTDPVSRFLVLWAAFVLTFFSLSDTKLPHYALYAFVPLALLMARQAVQHGPWLRAALWLGLGTWLALLTLLPWLAVTLGRRTDDPFYRALLGGAPLPGGHWLVVALAAGLLFWLTVDRWRSFQSRSCAAGVVCALVCVAWLWPWVGEVLQGPTRRAAWASVQYSGSAVQWDVHWPSVGYYREQPVPRRPPQPGELAFVRADRLTSHPLREDFDVLYKERSVALVRRKAAADGQTP